ncbi:hypothetical protein BA059_25045 [Mycolicibacterium sp. (ex Dasyatis americana)]|uniref:DUF2617 domain-containing protein n=1 Tax=Mycobacterium syngnathidarum TaxID=1908205 RepID=A0A1Q9W2X1_9MYCO|nr:MULTISPECIES: DUF2617 family protein [Mycobacterium]OFB36280.1 hypothetical protein BA059_25045 [Mycolicibacterium sp. (ex Dasyatis americana)]MCG7609249.1 DUF2617 family protein [Mycobacterium sp. CnD-18-1]OHT98944.1 hypothetical protein BKG61_14135 [Mycobacterium syngnathidarum]OLT87580.1 hypothetical protein BKG60_28530 [Mycobacterium syngnathidarum]TMS47482.1 DUF2617 family protein [Mycobacterium sp. DBP42]
MPLHRLAIPPADVSGTELRLALNGPAASPLVTHEVVHPDGGVLILGVLGASHIITVTTANCHFSEEVSCTAQAEAKLPGRAVAPGYRLDSHTRAHDAADFRRLAHTLRHRCTHDRGWLGGTFPGDRAALTALAAEPDGAGWHWQTWHLYPDATGGSVVYTSSRWRS